ncbi:MAG: prenyltransferase [Pseudomonadota bacterium]
MTYSSSFNAVRPLSDFQATVDFIVRTQEASGVIPWFDGGHADPWDHVESAMGLSIGREFEAAEAAYQWLLDNQLEDGSWWASYKDGVQHGHKRRETNFVAYCATGVWHHYLISQNKDFLQRMWPMVERAMTFVLSLQRESGDVCWAVDDDEPLVDDALRTGCSSIYKSIECAINVSKVLEIDTHEAHWKASKARLRDALLYKPERFDRTWESKARYSMDWFYPVLTGVIEPADQLVHLNARWDEFVEESLGCRCVSDQPWVTIAESCELTMSLLAAGDAPRAHQLFEWLQQWRVDDGSYWTGYQFIQNVLWPDEKPTWTSGAILLAADALYKYTPASDLFLGASPY